MEGEREGLCENVRERKEGREEGKGIEREISRYMYVKER